MHIKDDYLLRIQMYKISLEFKNLSCVVVRILDLSKYLKYKFHYDVIKLIYNDKI